jgi:hypothetical protein
LQERSFFFDFRDPLAKSKNFQLKVAVELRVKRALAGFQSRLEFGLWIKQEGRYGAQKPLFVRGWLAQNSTGGSGIYPVNFNH